MSNAHKARVDEDDDLDELDDVLQQFDTAQKVSQTSTQPASQPDRSQFTSASSAAAPSAEAPMSDFERELMKGMEDLMRNIASDAGLDADALHRLQEAAAEGELSGEDKEKERIFKAAWEAMLVEDMNGAKKPEDVRAGPGAVKAGPSPPQPKTGDSFQEGIKAAMDKLKQSDSDLQADTASDDDLKELLKQLNLGDESIQSEEAVQKALEKMMAQLMSRDILYEPLKELHEKFPAYLKDNASKLSVEDKARYEKQYTVVTKIITEFEDPAYSDHDQKRGGKIVDLMNEMQSHGSPPTEIMGPLPPGLELGTDGLPNISADNCTIV